VRLVVGQLCGVRRRLARERGPPAPVQARGLQDSDRTTDWAVRLQVSYDGQKRTFWRWHTAREIDGRGERLSTNKKPTPREIVKRFWDDTFAELHGFDFEREERA